MINTFQFDTTSLTAILPEIFLLSAIVIILLLDLFLTKPFKQVTYYLTQISLLITGVLAFNLIGQPETIILGGSFVLDDMASVFKVFLMVSAMVAMVYSRHYLLQHTLFRGEYFVLIMLSILGMMVMVSGYSLLTLYLGLEILSLSLYTLIAIARDRSEAVEAALKYFVLGAIASGLLLYGMSMIYGISGSLNIGEIMAFSSSATLASRDILVLNFGLVFLVIGIAFKLGAVPFHMWVPDVYQGAPTSVTMFISTVPKIAAVAMLVRLLVDGLGMMQSYWSDLFMMLAILSIALGSIVALLQTNIKRLLAYSTISHIGFVLLGFSTGVVSGYGAAVFYILAYVLMSLAAFGVIILLNKKGFEADLISDYKGLSKHSPWFALMMLIVMLSMAGMPPFIGFYAKLLILQQVVSSGMIIVAIIAVVFAVISAYYYLQIIKSMYFEAPDKEINLSAPIDMKLILSINAVLILVVGLFPDFWMKLALSLF
ncbi:NADH-ubiquinone oxidoreductase chain N (EC 1.6.5.3) [uncultured Gammaproteobacteria bacterium]|jgi:NADH-quinone oxidoreductase subunit N|nr:NADH-ubiquinone oxidoreductase chain N (EC [Bathymodiolus brooksi thiotrophic gill symbiont]CAC9547001.1 NADH-ubiquinone oxidoreductase chain N (EC 1.6.5.3) [uncultured Gammaproteobacteria bacterium]CAB9542390.1 NADH-ubiquinone oxidoreductase chain N (EC [Bathymodiolus brooksi thiotrophic gill symbiont]CAC9550756.1 NADH-ubiquinone oxidoreductase chain N (EC 1.6.5.3) [uncultured Gammaproteobacteria bacterium]CAC9552812.1 NADH-ubiquinone oxidoreductase chain N (EC 1.6.5.3) [uncultured Gammapro